MERDWKEDVLAEIRAELEQLEAAGEGPRDAAELEALAIGFNQRISRRAWEAWMKARAERGAFSP